MQTTEICVKSEKCHDPTTKQETSTDTNAINRCEISEFDLEPSVPNWPKLQQDALYGLAGEFVQLATENSEADPAAVLLTFLTRFGVECGPGPHFMVGDSKHYPRIFSVLVGASSKARKGTSAKPVEVLFNLDDLFSAKNEFKEPSYATARSSPGPLSSGEGITHAVRDETKEWKTNKKTGQGDWVITDPGIIDKRLYIVDEEFASALSCTKREGNTLSPILRNVWDNGTIDPLTKTSKISATGAHIGIVTHITIPELSKMLNDVEAFNGFANRFLWACVRRSKHIPLPRPMEPGKLYLIQEKLMGAIMDNTGVSRMDFSSKAMEFWCQIYEVISEEHRGLSGSVMNRAEAQVIRLSMLYALLDASIEINCIHLKAALSVWDYCKKSVRFIFAGRSENPIADRILLVLKDGPKSRTELYACFKRHISAKELNPALCELIAQGKLLKKKVPTKGAPKTVYKLT